MKKNKIILIGEAGVNHNGNMNTAKRLIDIAKKAGADFVKFQSFKAEDLVIKKSPKAKYQILNSKKKTETQFEMLKSLELNKNDHINLIDYCNKKKIKFLSTPFEKKSFLLLKELNQKIYKISSSDLNNFPFLNFISENCNRDDKIILSTGMSNIKEIEKAVKYLCKGNIKKKNISILHCTSSYPARFNMLNLYSIQMLQKKFMQNVIGYSDHTKGDTASILAIGLGAKIIEKHFTLSKSMTGPDHKASLSKEEFCLFAKKIFSSITALGNKNYKQIMKSELEIKKVARKSLFANRHIEKGEKFTEDNLCIKRPGTGLEPENYFKLIGKKAKKKFNKDEKIKF